MTQPTWDDLPDDPDELLAHVGALLSTAVGSAVGPWIISTVTAVHDAWAGSTPESIRHAAEDAADVARSEVTDALDSLAAGDVDDQRVTPLEIVRRAAHHATRVLADAGVPELERDPHAVRRAPHDRYGIEPAALADVDPGLHEIGIVWGAAKARAHLVRHRPRVQRVVALVPDLMDASKLRSIEPRPTLVRTVAELIEARADVAVVDLTRIESGDELSAIARSAGRTVGFGPHVDRVIIDDARSRGVEALPRSRFFADVAAALGLDDVDGSSPR